MREYLHGKIHKATITEANLEYVGSITIDQELMDKVDIHAGEKVLISDLTNGARLETYVIAGKKGEICMNGSTAHLMHTGDQIIIMGFEFSEKPISPKIILVDNKNNFIQYL